MSYAPGELDLIAPQTHVNPWPMYEWLRENAPCYRDKNGIWCVSRYDDIVAISMDPDTFTSTEGNRPLLPADHSFIHLDGPSHRMRRSLVEKWFGPRAIQKMEQHLRDVTNSLLDNVIESGKTEFVADVSAPLPARIMCEMTGIPLEMSDEVREWLDVFIRGGNGPDYVDEMTNDAFFKFGLLHMDLVEAHRAEPQDDLLQIWIDADLDGEKMNEDELLFEHTMLMIGGSETSRNAITSGMAALAAHPEQRQWLLENPEGMNNAVEEIIRWATPFISMSRTATKDVEFAGQQIKEGDCVMMLYPPANRDPRKFDNPQQFDIRRNFKKGQLAFGYGRHFCLGARLARAEVKVVFEEVLRRMPDWELDGEPTLAVSSFIQGYTRLPLRFTPGARENT